MTDASERRDKIDAHRAAGTCFICGLVVIPEQGYNGATGAHWKCAPSPTPDSVERAFVDGDAALKAMGLKPRRRREGEGRTAQKALQLAVEALERELESKLYGVCQWNQKGAYRGPRWDLDAWGLSFRFKDENGHEHGGCASSLATMTDNVRAGRLKVLCENHLNYTLWADAPSAATGPGTL